MDFLKNHEKSTLKGTEIFTTPTINYGVYDKVSQIEVKQSSDETKFPVLKIFSLWLFFQSQFSHQFCLPCSEYFASLSQTKPGEASSESRISNVAYDLTVKQASRISNFLIHLINQNEVPTEEISASTSLTLFLFNSIHHFFSFGLPYIVRSKPNIPNTVSAASSNNSVFLKQHSTNENLMTV